MAGRPEEARKEGKIHDVPVVRSPTSLSQINSSQLGPGGILGLGSQRQKIFRLSSATPSHKYQ
jgi:hypothetical protein